ncbi:MAG: hypothetical protein ACLQVD_11960 [Capsulimonadaceae bacterium]
MDARKMGIIAGVLAFLLGGGVAFVWSRTHTVGSGKVIDGTWLGTIDFGRGMSLRLGANVTGEGSTLAATLVSPDQSSIPIPADTASFNGTEFAFDKSSIDASYKGTVTPDGNTIQGTFTQRGMSHPLVLTRVDHIDASLPATALSAADAEVLDGDWKGVLTSGSQSLHQVVHFKADDRGNTSATLISVDQGNAQIPVTFTYMNGALDIKAAGIGGEYHGSISADRQAFTGTWTQLGRSYPINLSKS